MFMESLKQLTCRLKIQTSAEPFLLLRILWDLMRLLVVKQLQCVLHRSKENVAFAKGSVIGSCQDIKLCQTDE